MADEIIKPLHNKVLIKEDEKEKVSRGGILIPETAKDGKYSTMATVVAVGKGRTLDNGILVPIEVQPGDRIILGKHHGTEVTYLGEPHRLIEADVIDGVVETPQSA